MTCLKGLVILALVGTFQSPSPAIKQAGTAEATLNQARKALGSSDVLAAVKSVVVRGTVRANTGQRVSDFPIEFYLSFPGQFVSIMRVPGSVTASGADRDVLLYQVERQGNGMSSQSPVPEDMLQDEHRRMTRLALLLVLRTNMEPPLALQPAVTRAESALTLGFRDRDGAETFVDIDPTTHLPLRLRYETRLREGMLGPRTGARVSIVEEVKERKTIDGVQVPVRLEVQRNGAREREFLFETVRFNASAELPDFKKFVYRK